MIGNLIIEIFKQHEETLYWEGKETNQSYPMFLMQETNHEDINTLQKKVMEKCKITILSLARSSFELNQMTERVKEILDRKKGEFLGRKIKSIRFMGMNPEVVGEDVMALDFDVYVLP